MIKTHHVLLLFLAICAVSSLQMTKAGAFTVPFSPTDVLPLFPRQASRPILNMVSSEVDLLPSFVGAANATNDSRLNWKGACFYNNTAWLELHNKSGSEFGGGTLHIKVTNAHSWTCMDLYIFATPFRVRFDYYALSREHTFDFREWQSKDELEYVKSTGISIFLMHSGMLGTLQALGKAFPLFSNTEWGEISNIEFLEKRMGASFEERPQPWVANITVDDIQSGDFLALSKIRGRWGAFETLEKWVTGSYAGHSAVCLRDPEGKLWVAESGHENEKGEDIIAVISWDEWWQYEQTKDESNPHIALLPLHPQLRAKFNETAAWEYAKSMEGKPYGYHNMIFSWIDTIAENYPEPLDANLVASFMTLLSQLKPTFAGKLWNEALNKRLGTQNLNLSEILVEVEKRGSSFGELLAVPEHDDWIYSDGKSTSCVAHVFAIYKEAGLFGNLSSNVQATEFTIKDAYTIKFFENNPSRLAKWCTEGDTAELPFCQILGKYRMELPGFNTIDPYANMSEKCPSLPPKYDRPARC